MVDVYFNAAALLRPKTGIGEYCLQLMRAMQNEPEIYLHYFYNWRWSEDLIYPGTARLGKSIARRAAEKVPNLSYGVYRSLRSILFSLGIKRASNSVYHEPGFLAFRTSLPTVVTIHDLSVIHYPETHPDYRIAIMRKRIGESARRADCVITDSEYVRREVIAEFGISDDKVVTTLLAASPHFRPIAEDQQTGFLAGFGLSPGKYLLAVGTIEPRKNLKTAIQSFTQLPERVRKEFPFVIVGMEGWKMDGFDREIARLIKKGQVRFLGYVADAMLPALYSGARVLVYPSLYEGFGLPPLEAMACGTPVIVSDRASLPEVVGDAGLKVDALDKDALAEAMLLIIENDSLRLQMSRRGLAQAATFSWERCARETAAVYRKVAA